MRSRRITSPPLLVSSFHIRSHRKSSSRNTTPPSNRPYFSCLANSFTSMAACHVPSSKGWKRGLPFLRVVFNKRIVAASTVLSMTFTPLAVALCCYVGGQLTRSAVESPPALLSLPGQVERAGSTPRLQHTRIRHPLPKPRASLNVFQPPEPTTTAIVNTAASV